MDTDVMIYCPLMEDDNTSVEGWDKETIHWVVNHKPKVFRMIRSFSKSVKNPYIQVADVEDIYSEILSYLYSGDDYDITKAIERSSTDSIVSLEGYLNSCIKYCVIRHCTNKYKEDKELVRDSISDKDGKEISLLSNLPDLRSEESLNALIYDLEALCKSYEASRYKYGQDIYQILFIRLLTFEDNTLYDTILNVIGISKKELHAIKSRSSSDESIVNLVNAIIAAGVKEAASIIQRYVFAADQIKRVVQEYS